MSREYTVEGSAITVANQAVSLVAIMPPAGSSIEIIRCWVNQAANATSAQQRISIGTKATAYQTVVSATPKSLKAGDPVSQIVGVAGSIAAGKCGINASAEGAGTYTEVIGDAFNVLNGYLWIPTPRETFIITGTSAVAFTLQFPAAPVALSGWNFGVTFSELG